MHLHAQSFVMQGLGHAVLDRSFYGDTAFAHLQLQMGLMEEREFASYADLYDIMTAFVKVPTICLRILTRPEICNERIRRRMELETGRKCEQAIDLEYLKGLEREIDHMVGVLSKRGVAILDVPWDDDKGTPESRRSAVEALASRVRNMATPHPGFLDLHRRGL